jgi:hypothetical protein
MEFQTKENKRKRTIRLFTCYVLIAVLIGLASLILVYLAQGYGYDTDKGVNQSGLVFIDSKPSGADIYVDGQKRDKRISLNEGSHTITIKKDKYRDWSKNFNLEGGAVMYFLYPKLFPVDITIGITRVYPVPPVWVSQSPDRHWLILQQQANLPNLSIIDLTKPTDEPKSFTIPIEQMVVQRGSYGEFSPVEWSDDNQHLLIKQKAANGTTSYIIIDREDSDKTANISGKFGLSSDSSITLRDKKYDKYYIHTATAGELRQADLKNGLSASPILTGVVNFKSYADNLITYTTYEDAKANEANVLVLSNQTDKYLLQSIPRDPNNNYLLDMAQYDNNWYYVVASSADKKVYLYRNPLKRSKPGNAKPIMSQMNLTLINPQYVSFSDNARFIGMQSGKKFVVYDGEQNRIYRFESKLNITLAQQAKWMDGHRFTVVTDGKVQVFEFDGTNQQTLINSRPGYTPYFDRDYKYVFTLITQMDGKVGFENGQIILN